MLSTDHKQSHAAEIAEYEAWDLKVQDRIARITARINAITTLALRGDLDAAWNQVITETATNGLLEIRMAYLKGTAAKFQSADRHGFTEAERLLNKYNGILNEVIR